MRINQTCIYLQGSKPWRYTGKEEHMEREDIKMLVKNWRDIYEDPSLDFNYNDNIIVKAANNEHTTVKLGPFISALADAGVHDQRSAPSAA